MSDKLRRCLRCGQLFPANIEQCHHCHRLDDRQLQQFLTANRRRASAHYALGLLLLLLAFLIGFFMLI